MNLCVCVRACECVFSSLSLSLSLSLSVCLFGCVSARPTGCTSILSIFPPPIPLYGALYTRHETGVENFHHLPPPPKKKTNDEEWGTFSEPVIDIIPQPVPCTIPMMGTGGGFVAFKGSQIKMLCPKTERENHHHGKWRTWETTWVSGGFLQLELCFPVPCVDVGLKRKEFKSRSPFPIYLYDAATVGACVCC